MENQSQNNLNQTNAGDVSEVASASPSWDGSKLDLAEEYLNNWKRERADFVNYKKDEAKRMEEFIKFANESLIFEVIEALDDLELAQREIKNEGLGGVIKKFEDLLNKYGIEKIKTGDRFDPMLHEVVEGTDGEKTEEVRAGYTMHSRVIRPARIKIIK